MPEALDQGLPGGSEEEGWGGAAHRQKEEERNESMSREVGVIHTAL